MSVSKALFDLGARVGSLEGYVYEGKTVAVHYLPGWVRNIEKEFLDLPSEAKSEILSGYREILSKIDTSLRALLPEDDPTLALLQKMISESS
jgi:hypothetical protein